MSFFFTFLQRNSRYSRAYCLICVLLCLSPCFVLATSQPAPLANFTFGAQLVLPEAAPFYQVKIPAELYNSAAWSDLRDIRVFDKEGSAIPFAFINYDNVTPEIESVPTVIEKIDHAALIGEKKEGKSRQFITAEGESVNFPHDVLTKSQHSYLITLASRDDHRLPQRLKLHWLTLPEDWIGRVALYQSKTLSHWQPVIKTKMILERHIEDQHLLIDTIELADNQHEPLYYWLVFRPSEAKVIIPELKAIDAIYDLPSSLFTTIPVKFQAEQKETTIEYQLPAPTLLHSITFIPKERNTAFVANIAYRQKKEGKWLPLTKQIIYSFNQNDHMAPLLLNNKTIHSIQLTASTTPLPEQIPLLYGARQQAVLLFADNNKAPYFMVWGAKAAKAYAKTVESLLPEAQRSQEAMRAIPWATLAQVNVLNEHSPMTQNAISHDTKQLSEKWGTPMVGIGLLALGGYFIYRFIKRVKKPSDNQ